MLEDNLQQGTSLYIAFMITAILLAIALGVSTIFISQTKMLKGMGNSVIAFYAADAGIEEILMVRDNPPVGAGSVVTLSNDATYQVFVTQGGFDDCSADNFCIKSIGTYQETRRAIEIVY